MIRSLSLIKRQVAAILFYMISVNIIFSQGSPPLLLDDTGTPGNGNWEINLVAALEHSQTTDQLEAPLLDINYGFGERVQLKIEIPLLTQIEEGFDSESRVEGLEFGLKYRFLGIDDEGSSFSCYPQMFTSLYNEGLEFFLPIEYHYQWETYGLTAELGHAWTDGIDDGWEGGLGGAVYFRSVKFLLEFHSKIGAVSSKIIEPMINIGVAWDWTEYSALMFSIGKSIHNRIEENNLWSLCGIQFLL